MKKLSVYIGILTCLFCSLYSNSLHAQFLKKLVNTVKNTANGASDKASPSTNKADQQSQSDTAAVDAALKGLGILIGGDGVSAADSAAAIKSFMKSSSGSGFYYETTNTVVSKRGTTKSINKTYFTSSGEGRFEMNLAAMMGFSGGSPIVGISRADKPLYSVLLDDEAKTYSLNIINSSLVNAGRSKYTVTKIGSETIGNILAYMPN
jgi:hypothetical protein